MYRGLLNRVEKVNQVRRLLFRLGRCLRTVEGGFGTGSRSTSSTMTRSSYPTASLLGQIFASTNIKIRVIQVVLEKSRQICGSVFEFGYFQPCCVFETSCDTKIRDHFLCLRGECFVDLQGALAVGPGHFKIMLFTIA